MTREIDGGRLHHIDYWTDEFTAQNISELCGRRSHDSVDEALDEAVLFQAFFMDLVRKGVRIVLVHPDGRREDMETEGLLVSRTKQ